MSYLVLARKWRPREFDDLVGQEPITRILKNAIGQGRIAHAYIFSGPRGVGKTSSARILAKALNCKEGPVAVPCGTCESCTAIADGSSVDVIEIDGASNNSVDDIRDLRERVKYAPSGGKFKVYIIDEVHMLSGSAFNALLKTLEEPPPHVIFVLATTEMRKIPAPVLSRCQHMPFRRISSGAIRDRLLTISEKEGITISAVALGLVARAADGSMRDSLTILDQLASFSTDISDEDVKSLLGLTDFGLLLQVSGALIRGDRSSILGAVEHLSEQGTDIRSFARELVQFFRDLLVASVMKDPAEALDLNQEELASVRSLAAETSEDQLTLMLSELVNAASDIRGSSSPRLALEMALIRASFLSALKPIREVIEHISRYGGEDCPPPAAARIVETVREAPAPKDPVSRPTRAAPQAENPEQQVVTPPVVRSGVADPDKPVDVLDAWRQAASRLEQPTLSSVLLQAKAEVKGDELVLILNGGHAELFEESISKNLGSLEKWLEEASGRKLKITTTVSSKKTVRKRDLREKVLKEPVIKEALELFEGRIVDIQPVDDTDNKENGGDDV